MHTPCPARPLPRASACGARRGSETRRCAHPPAPRRAAPQPQVRPRLGPRARRARRTRPTNAAGAWRGARRPERCGCGWRLRVLGYRKRAAALRRGGRGARRRPGAAIEDANRNQPRGRPGGRGQLAPPRRARKRGEDQPTSGPLRPARARASACGQPGRPATGRRGPAGARPRPGAGIAGGRSLGPARAPSALDASWPGSNPIGVRQFKPGQTATVRAGSMVRARRQSGKRDLQRQGARARRALRRLRCVRLEHRQL
jgi:hypothetical protein